MTLTSSAEIFRQRLRVNEPSLVVNVDHPSPGLVESLCKFGVDAVMFDAEQGSPDVESIENMARAARVHGVCSLVRTQNSEPWGIERMMFRGVDGVIVPRAESIEDVDRIVADYHYCLQSGLVNKLLVVQFEHCNLLDQIDNIARHKSIDCVFIGPVDLAKSMGFGANYRHPDVMQAIEQTIAAFRRHNVAVGILVKPAADMTEWVEKGVSFLYCHADDFLGIGIRHIKSQLTCEGS